MPDRPEPITAPPSEREMASRIAALRARLAENRLDAYVVFDPDNIFYLTNFANYVHERPFVLVVPVEGAASFVVPELECTHVRIRAVGPIELVTYFEFPAPAGEAWSDRLVSVLPSAGRIGIEPVCPVYLADALPGEAVRTALVDDARMV